MTGFADSSDWQLPAGLLLALLLGVVLYRQTRAAGIASRRRHAELIEPALALLDASETRPQGPNEPPTALGHYRGLPVQIRPIVDTLSTRKLPSLWLMVTMPVPLGVEATFDFMMRPAGGTSFSNFDRLPHAAPTPAGWPIDGLLRTDSPAALPDITRLEPLTCLLELPQLKEILVEPRGVRVVVQLAEADRARYGVFRQASFGDIRISPPFLMMLLDCLASTVAELRQERVAA